MQFQKTTMSNNYHEKMSALNLTDKDKTNSGVNLHIGTGRLDDIDTYLG